MVIMLGKIGMLSRHFSETSSKPSLIFLETLLCCLCSMKGWKKKIRDETK